MTTIELPTPSLVVLVGASGSGKSSFARKHFGAHEVLSSDFFRGLVSGDENDQGASDDAFAALHDVLARRLRRGVLTVVDATNVEEGSRRALVAIAKAHDLLAGAIVLDVPADVCHERNQSRPDRRFGRHVVARQRAALRRSLRSMKSEGFHRFTILEGVEAIDAATITRVRLWTDRRDEVGPFDLIGDVHGCGDELEALLAALGYVRTGEGPYVHPAGRRAIFLGDLVDRGPRIADCLRIAMSMTAAGAALTILGNHEAKLLRALRGAQVKTSHGLQASLDQLALEPDAFRRDVAAFLDGLVSHHVLDGGKLVVAHAGMKAEYQGRASGRVREFALYGETTGEIDAYGLPVRADWAAAYRGRAAVVHGHTPVPRAEWVNGTLCVDTGCVFGGALTSLRWPERELVSIPAARTYFEPIRPLALERPTEGPRAAEAALTLSDVVGRRAVETRLAGIVTVKPEQASAALEAMSRFAIDPRWLVYLPPTMAPVDAAPPGEPLERPEEAFAWFLEEGVAQVLCEEKHMGSRAIAVVCRDGAVAARVFGDGSRTGVLHTRTGRPFFDDAASERHVLDAVRSAIDRSGLWDELGAWLVLDGELMPWSLKAHELVRRQYAAVGAAGTASLDATGAVLERVAARDPSAAPLAEAVRARAAHLHAFRAAYRPYTTDRVSASDARFGIFHVLASERGVHDEQPHDWHLAMAARLAAAAPGVLVTTPSLRVDLGDPESEAAGRRFWDGLVARGAEGMVVKPTTFTARNRHGLVQPALKVRGPEYLRIIYGPEYLEPSRLERLRKRNVRHKRRLALREHALGMEALHRFTSGAPLHRVHECVFSLLALESEPIDPRL